MQNLIFLIEQINVILTSLCMLITGCAVAQALC